MMLPALHACERHFNLHRHRPIMMLLVTGISACIATMLQALHGEQFVLVAKVSPQLPFDPAAPPAPVQGIPVVAETTLVLVSPALVHENSVISFVHVCQLFHVRAVWAGPDCGIPVVADDAGAVR